MALIPKHLKERLKNAGAKFDEDGNLIEDGMFDLIKEQIENENDDDQSQIDDNDGDDEGEDEVLQDEDEELEDQDSDEDEEDEEDDAVLEEKPVRKKKPSKHWLEDEDDETPVKPKDDQAEQILYLMEEIKRLREESQKKQPVPDDDEDEDTDENPLERQLREEVKEFQKMRLAQFKENIESKVNRIREDVTFDKIIKSKKWENYLSQKRFGIKNGDAYTRAIQNHDSEAVVEFFKDFIEKNTKGSSVDDSSAKKSKPNLDDLAVPAKNKTQSRPNPRKYDYHADDYAKMMEKLKRGKITQAAFTEFDAKFDKALKRGRIKQN